jgi:hypothetical protein
MQAKLKIVYVITKRDKKSYWNRIGVAFVNHDGSLNVKLEAVPVSGEMHIRDFNPREDAAPTLAPGPVSTTGRATEVTLFAESA